MADLKIITLDEAQASAEVFLHGQLKGLKKTAITKVKLSSVENIVVYEIEGNMTIGMSFFKNEEKPFKVQVNATNGEIVGYET